MQTVRRIKPGTMVVDRAKLRLIRRQKRLTVEGLATMCNEFAKRNKLGGTNLAAKTITRIEKGQTNPRQATIMIIAGALEIDWREIVEPTVGDPRRALEQSIELDVQGNSNLAASNCEKLLKQISKGNPIIIELTIRLATFYDHLGRWEDAIRLLTELLSAPGQDERSRLHNWARYQRAIVQRRLAEDLLIRTAGRQTLATRNLMVSAEQDLKSIVADKADPILTAILHQAGVLKLIEHKEKAALSFFSKALRRRERTDGRNPTDPGSCYRQGYELRRLGQCYALIGKPERAKKYLRKAQKIAKSTRHLRLLSDVERDLRAFGLSSS